MKKWSEKSVQSALSKTKKVGSCTVSLEQMEDHGSCFRCPDCKQNVYYFSSMPPDQIAGLLNENNEPFLKKLFKRNDDTIMTANCKSQGVVSKDLFFYVTSFLVALSLMSFIYLMNKGTSAEIYKTLQHSINPTD